MYVDVLVEVGVSMSHCDVDVGHLDLVVVLLSQDDVPNLVVTP